MAEVSAVVSAVASGASSSWLEALLCDDLLWVGFHEAPHKSGAFNVPVRSEGVVMTIFGITSNHLPSSKAPSVDYAGESLNTVHECGPRYCRKTSHFLSIPGNDGCLWVVVIPIKGN